MPLTFAQQLLEFYKEVQPPVNLPRDVEVLYPQQYPEVMKLLQQFLDKFYDDTKQRRLVLGINPGRFGAGITGINFTAPRQLSLHCNIDHTLGNLSELSAEFIYEMIGQYGGPKKFYSEWFLGSISPLGFIKNGKNMNYYDEKELITTVTPFIIENISKLLSLNFKRDHCVCIGGEKNFRFLDGLNQQHHWFQAITPLPHPRFIMQYKRKFKQDYVEQYLAALHCDN